MADCPQTIVEVKIIKNARFFNRAFFVAKGRESAIAQLVMRPGPK